MYPMSLYQRDGQYSSFYKLTAGVRQGGVLLPFLFAIFIDGIVNKIKDANVGCYVSTVCVSILLYADDIVLNLIRSKCLRSLLYCVEACPLFERDKHSFDFSLTRIFMKLF